MNKKRIIAGLVLIPTALCLAIGIPKIEDYVRKRLNARHEERVEKLEKLIKWTEKIPAIEKKKQYLLSFGNYLSPQHKPCSQLYTGLSIKLSF